MTLRIAYMTGEYPRATDTFVQREISELRRRGFYIQMFSVRRPAAAEQVRGEQRAERDRTYYILSTGLLNILACQVAVWLTRPRRCWSALKLAVSISPGGLKALLYQLTYFLEAGVVARQMHRQKLVHLHNHFASSSCSVAMLASAIGDFSFSFTVHGPAIFFEQYRWRLDEKIKRALFVACISHFCRSQAMIQAPVNTWKRLHIVHCGVDPDEFSPAPVDEKDSSKLLFVGRLAAVKGLPILLEALTQLKADHPQLTLTVVGDGPDRRMLETLATELEVADCVQFVGYKSSAEVAEYLAQSDLFVMSSFAEGVPVVLMEAMAAGVAVIAPLIAGIPELIEDGRSGFLTPPGDAETLSQRIAQLLDDSQLRHSFTAAGRETVVEQFNLAHESAWLAEVMTRALKGEQSPIRPPQMQMKELLHNG